MAGRREDEDRAGEFEKRWRGVEEGKGERDGGMGRRTLTRRTASAAQLKKERSRRRLKRNVASFHVQRERKGEGESAREDGRGERRGDRHRRKDDKRGGRRRAMEDQRGSARSLGRFASFGSAAIDTAMKKGSDSDGESIVSVEEVDIVPEVSEPGSTPRDRHRSSEEESGDDEEHAKSTLSEPRGKVARRVSSHHSMHSDPKRGHHRHHHHRRLETKRSDLSEERVRGLGPRKESKLAELLSAAGPIPLTAGAEAVEDSHSTSHRSRRSRSGKGTPSGHRSSSGKASDTMSRDGVGDEEDGPPPPPGLSVSVFRALGDSPRILCEMKDHKRAGEVVVDKGLTDGLPASILLPHGMLLTYFPAGASPPERYRGRVHRSEMCGEDAARVAMRHMRSRPMVHSVPTLEGGTITLFPRDSYARSLMSPAEEEVETVVIDVAPSSNTCICVVA